ncbi:MAG: 50S ribosomal protein L14e [Candidatus Heimdallarchaeum aukensis]|uniref:50S ribosomal protein L14e n=1 Tax=Candidatus Heimdallarchaeum aukensis TaxID=2876573 RepID=A0A9Y1BIJ2_9ARCH|nr:MAG: 50S ribosomal protein L14e [Candidatus Heimdallarchaeum aukensis]
MTAIQIGRIVVKTAGREAGKKAIIADLIDQNYVLITGPKDLTKVRRRKVNVGHIELTDKVVSIKRSASDDEIIKAIDEAGLTDFMKEEIVP